MTGYDVVVERRIAAAPSTVFAYFSDPDRWIRWQGIDAQIELHPGGVFRVNVTGDGYAAGEFLEVVRDRRIVFTWGWERPDTPVPPGSSRVEIDLVPDGEGTILRLVHRDLAAGAESLHRLGWENYVGRLAAVAEGRDPGPDPLRSDSAT